jgi:hypothetical protein
MAQRTLPCLYIIPAKPEAQDRLCKPCARTRASDHVAFEVGGTVDVQYDVTAKQHI